MDRREAVLKHVHQGARGIEIGPWFNPLAPKASGYNSLSLDVFDTDTLRRIAQDDPYVPNEKVSSIEKVDLVGSSTDILELVEREKLPLDFDYIISSHNFEHLANPIKFLRGCGKLLQASGFLSMAIPDKRVCFDYFRSGSTLSEWIEAYFEGRDRPTLAQTFDQANLGARYKKGEELFISSWLGDDPAAFFAAHSLREAYDRWVDNLSKESEKYIDTHCWKFTPSRFRLLIEDAHFLGLSPFVIEEISQVWGNEFFVHLKNVGYKTFTKEESDAYHSTRQITLHACNNEEAQHTAESFSMKREIERIGVELAQKSRDLVETEKRLLECADDEINKLQGAFDDAKRTMIADCESHIAQLVSDYEHRIETLEKIGSGYAHEIDRLVNSTSWKITSPIRWVKTAALRMGRRRHGS